MKLNQLNILLNNNNIIKPNDYSNAICCFFPVKWKIDWMFDSGAVDLDHTDIYTRDASISFNFSNPADSTRPFYPIDTSGKIFASTVSGLDQPVSIEGCRYSYSAYYGSSSTIEILLEQDDGDGNGVIDRAAEFRASGTIILIADHYNDYYYNGGNAELNALESIVDFPGRVGTYVPDQTSTYPKFPNAVWDYQITKLNE